MTVRVGIGRGSRRSSRLGSLKKKRARCYRVKVFCSADRTMSGAFVRRLSWSAIDVLSPRLDRVCYLGPRPTPITQEHEAQQSSASLTQAVSSARICEVPLWTSLEPPAKGNQTPKCGLTSREF